MEELLKLAGSPQSQRLTLFVLAYQILLVVLLVNKHMNSLGYWFLDSEIKLNTIIKFVLSPTLILVIGLYLFYTFIVFWLLRSAGFLFLLSFSANQLSEDQIIRSLQAFRFTRIVNNREIFKTAFHKKIIQILVEDSAVWVNSLGLNILARIANITFSTTFVYTVCGGSDVISPTLGFVLICLTIVVFLWSVSVLSIYSRLENLRSVLLNLSRNEHR